MSLLDILPEDKWWALLLLVVVLAVPTFETLMALARNADAKRYNGKKDWDNYPPVAGGLFGGIIFGVLLILLWCIVQMILWALTTLFGG